MKPILASLFLGSALVTQSWGGVLFAPVHYQERGNWDWAALSQSVLDIYGVYTTQTALAAWATPTNSEAPTYIHGQTTVPDRRGMDLILQHFGNISSIYFNRSLSESELATYNWLGYHVIAGKGNGIDLIYGYQNGIVFQVTAWPGFGASSIPYSQYIYENGYEWQETLVLTTAKPTTRPTRYIVESTVPRTYALYGVDRLYVNDGVKVYANPTTTTSWGSVGTGWWDNLNNINKNGIELGAGAKVGPTTSTGPVWMRSNSVINGNLTMTNTSQLSRQDGAAITGSVTQQSLPYLQPAMGTPDFKNVSKTTVNIEPDQPRTYLAPGTYWAYNIKQRSPIRLRAGDYYFSQLSCDGCSFEVDASSGPVRVYVADYILWSGNLSYVAGDCSRFMLGYLGKETIYINGYLDGTIIAPEAHLVLGQSSAKAYTGMYIAKVLTMHQYSVVRFKPFTFE